MPLCVFPDCANEVSIGIEFCETHERDADLSGFFSHKGSVGTQEGRVMLVIVTDYDKRFIGTRHYGSNTTMDNPDWEAHMMDFLHREFPRFYLDSILVIVDDKIVWESFMGSRIRKGVG